MPKITGMLQTDRSLARVCFPSDRHRLPGQQFYLMCWLEKTPLADKIEQAVPSKKALLPHTDSYFRSFDMNLPDYYLIKEWEREFDQVVRDGNLPRTSSIRRFNRELWRGMMGTRPYPAQLSGLDLRHNREQILAPYYDW